MNNAGLILVTGGARSGKSEFAEKFVHAYAHKTAYIATAEILDAEMQKRVDMHQSRRTDDFWVNYEAPHRAERIFETLPADVDMVLFDCVTIYVSNMMYVNFESEDFDTRWQRVRSSIDALLLAAGRSGRTVLFVTNEVGLGIVPDKPLPREYRDVIGWVNRRIADACRLVYFTVCGQTIDIKKLAIQLPVK